MRKGFHALIAGLTLSFHNLFCSLKYESYVFEFVEGNLSVEVFICFNNSPVDKLLQLYVRQVGAHHHFQHRKQLAIRDVPVVVDIVDRKRELQLLLLICACRQRVESLNEL